MKSAQPNWLFMGISVSAAAIGFLGAWFLYYKRTDLPAKMAASAGGLYHWCSTSTGSTSSMER